MIGQKLNVFTLLDHDGAGEEAKEKLLKKWITKYNDTKSTVETLAEILDIKNKEISIEDIFPEDYYIQKVQEVYKSQLTAAGIKKIKLIGNDMLCNKVERALSEYNISFNKGSVAKIIRKEISQMKTSAELPSETKGKVQKIISRINSKLSI